MASLRLRVNVTFGVSSIVVFDTTCKFNSGSNEGGYGDPNKAPQQATAAQVEITIPGVVDPVIITDIFPTLPNDDGDGFEITSADLLLNELPVGEWGVKYTVTFSDGSTSEVDCKFLNTCPLEDCLNKRVRQLDAECNNEFDEETFKLQMSLIGAIENHCQGNFDKADEIAKAIAVKCDCCC